jgi:hypothetical protein
MGGGDGGVITRRNAAVILSDPQVHGRMPHNICECIDPILAKDEGDWTHADRVHIAHAYGWAVVNL